MNKNYDLVVIGAGPGGYVAAIRASQLGLNTAVIENREVGGTCLNRGCIPTKSLLHASELYHEAKENFETLGLSAENVSFDANKVQDRKDEVVKKLRGGIETLFKSDGVAYLKGTGKILDNKHVSFKPLEEGEEEVIEAKNILIATGSLHSDPPVEGLGQEGIVTSDELLNMREMPEHLIVAGAGVIGLEFASMYNAFGKKVTIMASRDRILPKVDKELAQNLTMVLKKRGVKIIHKARLKKVTKNEDGTLSCWYLDKEEYKPVVGDCLLLASGRHANTEGLFAEGVSLDMDEKGNILVDKNYETSMKGVYAIGDVIPGMQLAHVASAEGIHAVEHMAGKECTINMDVIPDCIYTSPEIASVGLTEEKAKELGINVKTGKASMMGNGKSMLSMQDRGFIKIVYDADNDCIAGCQMMCARATDMINEISTAIVNKLTKEQLVSVIRPHPTFGEAVTEAVEDIDSMAIHIVKKKKI